MSTRELRAQNFNLVVILLAASALSACGGSGGKPAEEPAPAAPLPSSETSDPGAGTSEGEAMSDEELAALAEVEQHDAPSPAEAGGGPAGREVVYRMTPDGLKVEVDGAVFAPTAKSYMTPEGYGVEITVEATSKLEGILANPEAGPLAFGGRVIRKTGRVDQFGDKRSGTGTKPLGPTSPQKFTRKWPIANVSLLSPGDELELEIGLWGYGPKDGEVRPVRKFASVKMKASSSGATPIVDAPGQ